MTANRLDLQGVASIVEESSWTAGLRLAGAKGLRIDMHGYGEHSAV